MTEYLTVTEVPGNKATREQIERMTERYRFAASFGRNGDVLEVACGAGLGLGLLARTAKRIVGIDIDESVLRFAREHYRGRSNIEIRQMDAERLDFADRSFDLALSEAPLYQAPFRFPLRIVPCPPDAKSNLCLAARVRLKDIGEILTGTVEMVTVIFDDQDNVATLKKRHLKVAGLKGETASFGGSFSLPPGAYKCRLVLRNLETGRAAVASTSAVIPSQ